MIEQTVPGPTKYGLVLRSDLPFSSTFFFFFIYFIAQLIYSYNFSISIYLVLICVLEASEFG